MAIPELQKIIYKAFLYGIEPKGAVGDIEEAIMILELKPRIALNILAGQRKRALVDALEFIEEYKI